MAPSITLLLISSWFVSSGMCIVLVIVSGSGGFELGRLNYVYNPSQG